MQAVGIAQINDQMNDSRAALLAPVEYGYYFFIFYMMLGSPLGLILMGGIGAGFLLILILGVCFVALGPSLLTVVQTIWIPIACGASYLFIQLALHSESLFAAYVYSFGPWLISLVIVQALAMYRPNFLHRFAIFTLFMGLAVLPFVTLQQGGVHGRIGLDQSVGYANPNALASWFGFCVLYLTIRGYVEIRLTYRLAAWLAAAGALYVVTLTVSRGALLALVCALLVASRSLLKLGPVRFILLAGLAIGLTELGVFDKAIESYAVRAGQETGRFLVWPLLIDKFLSSPLIGIGASHAGAVIITGKFVTPHNSFLLFAVASGAVPLILFCAYMFQCGMASRRAEVSGLQDAVFYLPLVVYGLLITCAGNLEFMAPWAIVSLAGPVAAGIHRAGQYGTSFPESQTAT